jgi:hypothetical protein
MQEILHCPNSIQRINWTNNSGSNWFGIAVDEGLVVIGITDGNKIGGLGAAVSLSNTASVVSNLYGIHLADNNFIKAWQNTLTNLNLTSAVDGSNLYVVCIKVADLV